MSKSAFPQSLRCAILLRRVVVGLLLALGLLRAAHAAVSTTTSLSAPASPVAVGVPALLTATVTDAASHPVLLGTVAFYDGARVLGSAQIVSRAGGAYPQGTANLKTASFAPGANNITAVFTGTTGDLGSTSAAKTVTVPGKSRTAVVLSSLFTQGQYTLTAELQAFGPGLPTGSIDFLDTRSDTDLGEVPLGGAAWQTGFVIGSLPYNGSGGNWITTADFNNDGFLDLVTLNNDEEGSVVLGNGDGTYKPQAIYAFKGYPAIVSGDFNNDGNVDLAVDYEATISTVGILLGNGDGTFQVEQHYPIEGFNGASNLTVADLNGDGILDVVVPDNFGSDVGILLGNGDGTFQAEQTYATSSSPFAAVVGDLNGDGIPDLIVSANGNECVLLGQGGGTFAAPKVHSLGSGPYLALSDLNGDGKLDLVASNRTPGTVTVSLGKGDGGFQSPVVYSAGASPGQLTIADFNGDGKPDLAVSSQSNGDIQLLVGNGNGTFQPAVSSADVGAAPSFMAVGDFNGDGHPDLVTSTNIGVTETVLLNGKSTSAQLASVSGPALAQASYSGDEGFAASSSASIQLGATTVDFSAGFAGSGSELQLNGGASLNGAKLQLTDGSMSQAVSAFTKVPFNIQSFTTDFTFQILNPVADGFTFTIQNARPGAIGHDGKGLGYQSIQKSVAIKFDLHDNAGEGPNSTGYFTNGALPTVPAQSLTGTGIDLHSGDAFKAHIAYDGANLALTLSDTKTSANWSHTYTGVDIPSIVGGSSAYVGFTAATGGESSNATIATWKYQAATP